MTSDDWKSESQHVAELSDRDQGRYSRLSSLYGLWAMFSFALPVTVAVIFALLHKTNMLEKLPLALRFPVTWKTVVVVAVIALPVHVVGALLLRSRMKRIVTRHLASREWS